MGGKDEGEKREAHAECGRTLLVCLSLVHRARPTTIRCVCCGSVLISNTRAPRRGRAGSHDHHTQAHETHMIILNLQLLGGSKFAAKRRP